MSSNPIRQCLPALCLLAVMSLTACAGNIPAAPKDQRAATDPWEPLNRRISNFNEGFDKVTFKPLAKGYQKIIPGFARQGVGNFSRNLLGPRNIINNVLQGKIARGGKELGRFVINSVMGHVPVPASRIVDHVEHIVGLVGADHVALGSDFDGTNALPDDLQDVSQLPILTQLLQR